MRKELTDKEVAGMTVNERLYHAGLLDDFDLGLAQRNEPKLKSILEEVHLSATETEFI